jgi:hypothetical protein
MYLGYDSYVVCIESGTCPKILVKRGKRKRNQMKKSGKTFVKARRETVEKRDRIGLGKESIREVVAGSTEIQTVSGSVIPSRKARYVQGMLGRTTEKYYGEKAYLKGMNKRPRMKLTLGNIVTRKKRKRVEGVEGVDPQVVSGQRVRQVIRVVWDRLNTERRKTYVEYRKREQVGWRKSSDRNEFRKARQWYQTVRECEVYRNAYEVRARYQDHSRGKRRKEKRLEAKFHTSVRKEGKRRVEKKVRTGARETEAKQRDGRRATIRNGVERKFREAVRARETRRDQYPGRKKLDHVNALLGRSKQSRKAPLTRKNRDRRGREQRTGGEEGRHSEHGDQEFERGDVETEILRAAPTTQYFAKVKNLVREMDRVNAEGRRMTPSGWKTEDRAKKRRKVPEKKRIQRYPQWTEMEKWSNRLMQKVEDENLQKILRGEEVTRAYATYRELGKKALYYYAEERRERWETNREKEKIKDERGNQDGQPRRIDKG